MATKRERWSSEGVPIQRKKMKKSHELLEILAPSARLDKLPDNVTLLIMFYLDAASIIRLSRVSKRFYHLSQDEYVWMNVDMSTLPYMDIRNTKKFIDIKLSSKLYSIKIQSSYDLHGKAARKPKIDNGVLNTLVEKCSNMTEVQLINCDLTFIRSGYDHCKLLSMESLEKVSLINCNTVIHWLELAQWPCLTHLSLRNTVKTGEFEIKAISRNTSWRRSLQSLDLTGCYRVNDDCVKTLCQHQQDEVSLTVLYLSATNITDECLQYLPALRRLNELHLIDCRGLTSTGVLNIPKLLPLVSHVYHNCFGAG